MKRLALLLVMLMVPLCAAVGSGSLVPGHALADAGSPNNSQLCFQNGNFGYYSDHGDCVSTFRSDQSTLTNCQAIVSPEFGRFTYPYYITFGAINPVDGSFTPVSSPLTITSFGDCVGTFSQNKNFFTSPNSGVTFSQTPPTP